MNISALIDRFPKTKVLVVGDIMLDTFVDGSVERISPEAPVPVLVENERKEMLGGAGNVVANLTALGVQANILSIVGNDVSGEKIKSLLTKLGLKNNRLFCVGTTSTTKTRFACNHQQMMRMDTDAVVNIPAETEKQIIEAIANDIAHYHAVIISDYKKGVVTNNIASNITKLGREYHIPVFVDPKGKDYSIYKNATLVKPNLKEITQVFSSRKLLQDVVTSTRQLLHNHDIQYCLITLGSDGMLLVGKDDQLKIDADKREVFDVSGAGDTVIATLASVYGCGGTLIEACEISNIAAGIVVGKAGTATVSADELLAATVPKTKLFSVEELLLKVAKWKKLGQHVGFTNGCFDLLHAGHIQTLRFARSQCDKLIVAVNNDKSVKKLKGPLRPIHNETERMIILSELECVDAIISFGEDTPEKLIRSVCPDVLIKGADYVLEDVAGGDFVESAGGKVVLAPLVAGMSTTNIIKKVKAVS